ncbi:MAG: hypothetical protein ACM3KF_02510 [Acidobacteriota bacterium]
MRAGSLAFAVGRAVFHPVNPLVGVPLCDVVILAVGVPSCFAAWDILTCSALADIVSCVPLDAVQPLLVLQLLADGEVGSNRARQWRDQCAQQDADHDVFAPGDSIGDPPTPAVVAAGVAVC